MADFDFNEQTLLQSAREHERSELVATERRAVLVLGGLAAAAMALLWLLPVAGEWSVVPALVAGAGLLVTRLVQFDVGGGYTAATQLAFVPLLFEVPAQAIPLAVLAVMVLVRLPNVVRGTAPASRLVLELENTWFAIGPALALALIGGADALVAHPELMLAVLGAQYVGDFAASVLREWLLRGASLREQLKEAGWVYGIDTALTPVPLALTVGLGGVIAVLATLPMAALLASFARERRKRMDSLFELNDAYHGTALLLGDVVEADDSYTGEHCKSVVELALDVGQELGLDPARMRNLEFSALLHDVGKVAIPKEIINKPGKLDPREWDIIKTHTVEGQRMLDQIGGFMGEVGRIVRSHHERWDGGGYPDGLAADAIPLEARIVTACDSFSAMTTTRSYRAAMPVASALEELEAHAGTQFDERVVRALVQVVGRTEHLAAQPPPIVLLAA